ncbi:bifunctional glycosyltransferase family 2 protein/CDP-glycerol:glycerophosphate glycerophosphotransferase [Streptosporangium sp. NBC_01755]|uniref:bifunctional glycosyltransferase/CDP-glycerol:glycerophosphate glycerophosphotransferase n=1 Tax=unclassified Streptosporangium TaxID=2632669 RepID=UPI002DDC1622|nr:MULTISPECIES: bifunctional glycosyltransferase family 2 protein/CDP-glycerol:glycerophosphate glycerophosphotransferase [unclassified Streptosporangium]WSA24363.1 bifunctional glycosyltransferase family 2 protein/CDP-glycerol:glycerophosphate glycerophosphotransferase [Streptosporangium sp. NBC_01810]WSC97563.1 bifunctional glycosyltransferase family 2 protein/CDP-glycerol:glycerophosphate glycerophosphotransferase [Streptosporangium sp. NBC_01755]
MTQPYTAPDVSVIVITYNDASRLPRAVRSVLGQTLKNLEVVVVDDCSGDDTPAVAKALAEEDGRVRYLRLPANSGGCGAPRNAGMDAARAPFLMFLDSDDELPRHACKSLLLEAETTGADFVMGTVERVDEASGAVTLWYPRLFAERRIVDDIRAEPELLFNCLATNKLYRRTFLDGTGIRFHEDIHHEDIVWSTELFCRSKLFAVVPWPVYRWLLAATPATRSISSRRHELENVRQRVTAAVLSDRVLAATHSLDLKGDKDFRFLSHDLRLYLGDLPQRDPAWIAEFADLVIPYVDTLEPTAIERLSRAERVCVQLVRERRGAEAAFAAVELGYRHSIPPRAVTTEGGRVFWGTTLPTGEQGRSELDVTELHLAEQPLAGALLRHELVDLQASRDEVRLRLRTYDPGRVLDGRSLTAWLHIGGRKKRITSIPFEPVPVVTGPPEGARERRGLEGQWDPEEAECTEVPEGTGILEATVSISLPELDWPDNAVRPQAVTISLHEGERRNARPLLALPGLSFTSVGTVGTGRLVLEASADIPFRLMARRIGHVPGRRLPSLAELWQHLLSGLATPRNLGRFYRLVSATVPVNRRLVLFESTEGGGYTGNPRYVHEELQRRATGLRAVWSHAAVPERFPEDVDLVRRDTFRYAWTLARAGYWVDSHNLPYCYRKRKSTRYLQTWHGQVFKKMGLDEPRHRTQPSLARKYAEAVARWDVLLTPGHDFRRDFAEASGFEGELLHAGYPRTDVLVRHAEPAQRERARRVREFFEIPAGKRVILYAPTYRDGGRFSGESFRIDLPALAAVLPPDWVILVRAHPYDRFTVPDPLGWLARDASEYPEVNDLMLASDVLVTDYSSIMFDYACLGRPILYYVDDHERYASAQRGVCFDLAEVAPGPLLRDPGELAAVLEGLGEITERYGRRYAEFRDRWCGLDDGQASGRVVDAFFPEAVR